MFSECFIIKHVHPTSNFAANGTTLPFGVLEISGKIWRQTFD